MERPGMSRVGCVIVKPQIVAVSRQCKAKFEEDFREGEVKERERGGVGIKELRKRGWWLGEGLMKRAVIIHYLI